MNSLRRNLNRITSLALTLLVASGAVFIPGCGKMREATGSTYEDTAVASASEDIYDDEALAYASEDTYDDESVYPEDEEYDFPDDENGLQDDDTYEEIPADETDSAVDFMKNRDAYYETQNEIDTLEKLDYAPINIDLENFCDAYAINYAEENNCEDYLLWLADYVVNVVEPQAVEKLLQIPVLGEAAENGEISKYISIYLTHNDVNAFGAMQQSCYLGRDGHGLEAWDSPFYYIGHNVLVNLESFQPGSQDDPERLRFLESAMIHEMMHAFLTDYLFNLSLGTGRDGARVLELDGDGKVIMDENDRPNQLDVIPTWLQEGLAMTVENPYGTSYEELRLILCADAYDDDYLWLLSTPESLNDLVNIQYDELGLVNNARITYEPNTYGTGWIASLLLCAMAGEKLGYEVFDENGYLNQDAVFYGLNELISQIHDGHSLDSVIADISFDESTGRSAYEDTTDYEEKCFGSVDDPGLIFMQKLLFDFEARRLNDPDSYIPCGSVLPGYVNGAQHCMDDAYHEPSIVYEVDNIEDYNPNGEYFSISTIPLSRVALSGGRRTSYDPIFDPLSPEEEAERDFGYIGDEKKYIDLSLEEE